MTDDRPLDDLDRRLIALLRADARTPLVTLARRLAVSRGTVQNRMQRLERDGVITGYTIRLSVDEGEPLIRAFMMVAVEGNRATAVARALRGDPAVSVLYTTNGRWDLVAELKMETLVEFDTLLARVRMLEGVLQSETNLLLKPFEG
jgi:DNA-binding Lrp family transcriptional regulator